MWQKNLKNSEKILTKDYLKYWYFLKEYLKYILKYQGLERTCLHVYRVTERGYKDTKHEFLYECRDIRYNVVTIIC